MGGNSIARCERENRYEMHAGTGHHLFGLYEGVFFNTDLWATENELVRIILVVISSCYQPRSM